MPGYLEHNSYGKQAVNLSKIIRHDGYHEYRQISVDTLLEGDFDEVYLEGNNGRVLATDTQKNTVYALAKDHFTDSIEGFGLHLASHFLQFEAVKKVRIHIEEHGFTRMAFNGAQHQHAYIGNGPEKWQTTVEQGADSLHVWSGITKLHILKTTDSAFEGFLKDPYTTLRETSDRILATECEARWRWRSAGVHFSEFNPLVRATLLEAFAFHKSASVQQTLYAMGEAVLGNCEAVDEIRLVMPNKHHILFNLEPFGVQNNNEIFVATDAPYGYITGTVKRG